jgi:hypothetical protein
VSSALVQVPKVVLGDADAGRDVMIASAVPVAKNVKIRGYRLLELHKCLFIIRHWASRCMRTLRELGDGKSRPQVVDGSPWK